MKNISLSLPPERAPNERPDKQKSMRSVAEPGMVRWNADIPHELMTDFKVRLAEANRYRPRGQKLKIRDMQIKMMDEWLDKPAREWAKP